MKKYMQLSLLFITGLVLGVGGTMYYNKRVAPGHDLQLMESIPKSVSHERMDEFFNDSFDDDFFKENQFPFKQMEKIKNNMSKLFKESKDDFFSNEVFDHWYRNKFGGEVGDVKQDENKDSIFYKVYLPDVDKENVKVVVQDGMVNISAKAEKAEEEKKGSIVTKSSFKKIYERRFPLPSNASEDKVEINFDGEYLVIKFPKNTNSSERSYDV